MSTVSAIAEYLTLNEVAESLGITHSMVARYVRDGRLPSVAIGQQKLVPVSALSSFRRNPKGWPKAKTKFEAAH